MEVRTATIRSAAYCKRREDSSGVVALRPIVAASCCLLLLSLFPSCAEASYGLTLKPDVRECYAIRVPDGPTTLSGNFDCWEESESRLRGCRSISAWIESLEGRGRDVWRSSEGVSEEIFDVPVEGAHQRYRLCFESSKADAEKDGKNAPDDDDSEPYSLQLGFNVRVKSAAPRALPDEELGPDALRALKLVEAAYSTEQQWHNLLDHFDFLRNREAVHRHLTGQINDRVMGWTIIEAILVVSMAVGQVWYWKSFFEQRRYL